MLTGLRSVRAQGNRVKLDDDRWYTDWQAALRGDLYGFLPVSFHGAMADALARGPASSIAHQDERVVAEMLGGFYPVEAVRWMMNGSDACAAAVKIARAWTGRAKILSYGYHGWASCFASPPTPYDSDDNRRGTLRVERNAYMRLEWLDSRVLQPLEQEASLWGDVLKDAYLDAGIATIIVECPPVDGGREEAGQWLRDVAQYAQDCGALFILDEVVTGFRYAPGGAAEYYDILGLPDLYCFGKTLGQGVPIAALAGKAEIMEELAGREGQGGKTHASGTHFGEPLGLAAAKWTLQALREDPPWPHLYAIGNYLKDQWNALGLPWHLVGHPTRPVLEPLEKPVPRLHGVEAENGELARRLVSLRRHLFARGHIFVAHPLYVSMATTEEDVDALCEAAGEWEG
jgi:glutamate-1-semialdehyde aminotransferase